MTLVELMLVLALLVVVGSLSAPLLTNSFATVRLRRGTDQVLASWAQTRTQAIETGEIYQFRFEPETGNYQVELWQPQQATGMATVSAGSAYSGSAESTYGSGTSASSNRASTSRLDEQTTLQQLEQSTLPEGVVFAEGNRLSQIGANEQIVESLNQGSTGTLSIPILFFPDGTTSAATIILRNDQQVFQRATLRAITGVGRASETLSREQLERLQLR